MAHYCKVKPNLHVDEINSWFSLENVSSTARSAPCATYQGRCFETQLTADETALRTQETYDEDLAENNLVDDVTSSIGGDMFEFDAESVPPPLMEKVKRDDQANLEIYRHYDFNHEYDADLPIMPFKQKILQTIKGNSVTVIQGSTGSGKTTQVPQFILDDHAKMNKYCNIVITQPRKIAAKSLARRVCQERCWQVGQVVGYQVGLEKLLSSDTRLLYVTTGVLLQHLIKCKNLNRFTHIILDEIHERDQETDFAMLLVRKLLWLNSKSVKVVLMSATLNCRQIAEYFGKHVNENFFLAPIISIKGRLFDVLEHYAEDLTALGSLPKLDVENPEISDEAYALASRLILHFDVLESEIHGRCRGSVLVFLPGIFQIREFENILECERVVRKLKIIPLHSTITGEEQAEVFVTAPIGFRKIILSTNIAESSITVPDVQYVIDFCLTKSMVNDLETNYQSLRLQWASKASARQRAGRAGRVSSGRVYRMVSRFFWDSYIPKYGIPELQRCSLESAVLKVKILDLGPPKEILSLAISPPNMQNLERTILLLKEVGALSVTTNLKRFDGNLTFVGQVLASLPIDMRLGKMLMLGLVFGCLEDCLVIAASLSKQTFFATPYNKLLESFHQQLLWSNGSFSDCIALLNAYRKWESLAVSHYFRRKSDEKLWARQNFIQLRRLHEVHFLIDELRDRLSNFNIRSNDALYWEHEDHQQTELILKVVMAGAFYPNYFVQSLTNEDEAVRGMSMLNPSTTVVLSGLPNGAGPLFKESLINLMKKCGKINSLFYDGCKAFVEFSQDSSLNMGEVPSSVYLACKLRHIKRPLQVQQSCNDKGQLSVLLSKSPFLCHTLSSPMLAMEVPKPGKNVWYSVCVTHVLSGVLFWGYKLMQQNVESLHFIASSIDKCIKVCTKTFKVGDLVLAPYDDGTQKQYYRAMILTRVPSTKVWFVDYGNTETITSCDVLYEIPASLRETTFQAVRFRLHGIKMGEIISQKQAKCFLFDIVKAANNTVKVKIHSVVSNTANVELFCGDNHINQLLVNNGLCEVCDEGRLSEINHSLWDVASEDCLTSKVENGNKWTEIDCAFPSCKAQHKIDIQGPRTTYETSFFSVTKIGRLRNINIDRNGVNSISVNQDAKNMNRVMMIAAQVGINQSGSTMLARYTTIMPDIKGLLPLLCLMFAPVVEYRTDGNFTKYTGAICGLGSSANRNGCFSILPDHDMEVLFNFDFKLQDIIDINGLRMMINLAVGGTDAVNSWSQSMVHRIQSKAREKLLSFLTKSRTSADPQPCKSPYRWKIIDNERIIPHQVSDKQADRKDLYRLHDAIALQNV